MISMCPFAGDVKFDHLIKATSARLLHCEVTLFPLLYFVDRYSKTILLKLSSCLFIASVGTHGFLFYLMGCNILLPLF